MRSITSTFISFLVFLTISCGDSDNKSPGISNTGGYPDDDTGLSITGVPMGEKTDAAGQNGSSNACTRELFADYISQQSLNIRIRNLTSKIQYLGETAYRGDTLHLMRSGPKDDLLFYTNSLSRCEDVLQVEDSCHSHGDPVPFVVGIAPGAEYTESWGGTIFKWNTVGTDCGLAYPCNCIQEIEPPKGTYIVGISFSDTLDCGGDTSCGCDPMGESCTGLVTTIKNRKEITAELNWPIQTEVVLDIK